MLTLTLSIAQTLQSVRKRHNKNGIGRRNERIIQWKYRRTRALVELQITLRFAATYAKIHYQNSAFRSSPRCTRLLSSRSCHIIIGSQILPWKNAANISVYFHWCAL